MNTYLNDGTKLEEGVVVYRIHLGRLLRHTVSAVVYYEGKHLAIVEGERAVTISDLYGDPEKAVHDASDQLIREIQKLSIKRKELADLLHDTVNAQATLEEEDRTEAIPY